MQSPNPIATALTLVTLGVVVRMGIRLFYGVRGPDSFDPLYISLNVLAWVCLLSTSAAVGLTLLISAVVPLLLAAQAIGEVVVARRERQRAAAWSICTHGTERGQPLGPALRSAAGRFSGTVARQVNRLARELDRGKPLAEAAVVAPGALPRVARACLALSQDGGVPLKSVAHSVGADGATSNRVEIVRTLMFTVWAGAAAIGTVTFVMIAIVPEFEKIFNEFGLELPSITRAVVSAGQFFVNYWYLVVAPAFLVVLTMLALIYFDPATHRLLVYHWSRRQVLRLLAVAVEHRMPLDEAFARLSTGPLAFPDPSVTRDLRAAAARLASGGDWIAKLSAGRLLSESDAKLLHAAQAAGNLPWSFRSIAERRYHRSAARIRSATSVFITTATVVLGLAIGVFAVAMFAPLVRLIEGLV